MSPLHIFNTSAISIEINSIKKFTNKAPKIKQHKKFMINHPKYYHTHTKLFI